MNRTDLADPGAGILATLEGHQPLALFEQAADGATAATLQLQSRPTGAEAQLTGPLLGSWQIRAARLRGSLTGSDDSTTKLDGLGAITEATPPEDGADPALIRRSLVICFEEGDILALCSALPDGDRNAEREEIAAAYAPASGEQLTFAESLLSTEYGPDGLQRRVTLELWPDPEGENGGPVRGAGRAIAQTRLELPGAESRLVMFEWSVDGRPGIGRYEIIEAR